MNVLKTRNRLYSFTERLSELVSGGIPLQKSLHIIGKMNSSDAQMSNIASFLYKSLLDGMKFSVAMASCPFLKLPEWYIAYLGVAEECEKISQILIYLKQILSHEKKIREKFIVMLSYPILVTVLTAVMGFVAVFFFFPDFSPFFGGNFQEIQNSSIKSMIFADFFLFAGAATLLYFVKRSLSENPCLSVFKAFLFLSENGVPTLSAVSCVLSFLSGEKRIYLALLSVRNHLLEGEKVAACFGKCFEESGFKTEGMILSENLLLSEETGRNNAFEKTLDFLEGRKVLKEKMLVSILPPILFAFVALYLGIILKASFLPLIMITGGF